MGRCYSDGIIKVSFIPSSIAALWIYSIMPALIDFFLAEPTKTKI
jgi:hypothetical protein